MNNEQRVMELFYKQFPQFEKDRAYLEMNLYCDIMDKRKEKDKIIAVSDLPHDLLKIGYLLPSKWTLKE